MSCICRHIVVSGFVQGVGYRYFALRQAGTFGVTGRVRNSVTGEVEVFAFGDAENMARFIDALREGPSRSRVDRIQVEACDPSDSIPTNFEIQP